MDGGKYGLVLLGRTLSSLVSGRLYIGPENKAMRKSETKTSANLFLGDKEKERKVAKRIAEVRPAHISLLAIER